MALSKPVDSHLSKLLPVKFSELIIPGIFEYSLNWLVDHDIDLTVSDARYRNDEEGASAYHPAVLLRVVLLCYVDLPVERSAVQQLTDQVLDVDLHRGARVDPVDRLRKPLQAIDHCGQDVLAAPGLQIIESR